MATAAPSFPTSVPCFHSVWFISGLDPVGSAPKLRLFKMERGFQWWQSRLVTFYFLFFGTCVCISCTHTVDMQYDTFACTRSKQRLTSTNLSANFHRSVDNRVQILNFFFVDNVCMPQMYNVMYRCYENMMQTAQVVWAERWSTWSTSTKPQACAALLWIIGSCFEWCCFHNVNLNVKMWQGFMETLNSLNLQRC